MTPREQFLVDVAYVAVVYGVVPATLVRLALRFRRRRTADRTGGRAALLRGLR